VGTIKDYRDLDVWQCSVDLAVEAHRLARLLPIEEKFALSSQLRRAAVSVATNIAEGYGRDSRAEFMRFLRISRGSVSEVLAILTIAERLQYLSRTDMAMAASLGDRIRAMLTRLVASLALGRTRPG